jgi:signal transduction histidine kinase
VKALAWLLLAVVVGMALFEVTMQPSGVERVELATVFVVVAALGLAAARSLPRLAASTLSIRRSVVAVAVTAVGIGAAGVLAAAERMFLSSHDLSLLLVVLGFALVASIGFTVAVARPLMADLEAMSGTAARLAAGDLSARTTVDRGDEVGDVARALDSMAAAMETSEDVRRKNEEARRRFLAAVGHDLRTPLASLQAALEALRDGVAPDPGRYLTSMESDVEALNRLVEDLFLLARIEHGSFALETEPIDITELADEAIEVMRPVAHRRGVVLRLDAASRTVATGSPEALSRVLRNVLDNAIRHAPAGTTVVVEVGNGAGASVRVADEGPGFDADFVLRAFDPFTRSDPARSRDTGGTGLGLAIAKGFITALDGEIWAEPGPGGVVALRLPAA